METNEIMTNDEVMFEVAEDIVPAESGNGLKIALGIGLAVLVGGVVYKYVVKPIWCKVKAAKEEAELDSQIDDDETNSNSSELEDDLIEA